MNDWLFDIINILSDILDLRHMNMQEHRHQILLRLLVILAFVIVGLGVLAAWLLERI